MIFDDVEVPMDRVFIDGSQSVYDRILTYGWASNVLQQTTIRAAVKLEFIYDLCVRVSEITNARKKTRSRGDAGRTTHLWPPDTGRVESRPKSMRSTTATVHFFSIRNRSGPSRT